MDSQLGKLKLTDAPWTERGGRSKDGRYMWKGRSMKGTEADFGGEKVEFRDIPGVVEELSFLRYVAAFLCRIRTSSLPSARIQIIQAWTKKLFMI